MLLLESSLKGCFWEMLIMMLFFGRTSGVWQGPDPVVFPVRGFEVYAWVCTARLEDHTETPWPACDCKLFVRSP